MVTLDWETERTDGVTLVRLYVTSEYRRHVRVENRLDGPVWPPRREGQPAAGWDGDTYEGVVTPDDRLVAGYATPAPPADPPAAVVGEEPADPDTPSGPAGADDFDPVGAEGRLAATDGGGGASTADATSGPNPTSNGTGGQFRTGGDGDDPETPDDDPTPGAVVRSLGDPVVPREAVPVPDTDDAGADDIGTDENGTDDTSADENGADDTGVDDTDATETDATDASTRETTAQPDTAESDMSQAAEQSDDGDAESAARSTPGGGPDGVAPPGTDAELVVPGAVRAWLCDVDRRLRAVERRRETEPADPDPTLQVAVAGDRRALELVADRVETLAGRAAAVERRAGSDGRR